MFRSHSFDINPEQFVQWLDSDTPELHSGTIVVYRLHSASPGQDDLDFCEMTSHGTIRDHIGVVSLKKDGACYTIFAPVGLITVSDFDIFSDRVILKSTADKRDELLVRIYAFMAEKFFPGEEKVLNNGFLGNFITQDPYWQGRLQLKPSSGLWLNSVLRHPELIPFYDKNIDVNLLFSKLQEVNILFLDYRFSDLAIEIYASNQMPDFVEQYESFFKEQFEASGGWRSNNRFLTSISNIFELNQAIAYLRRFFPTAAAQEYLLSCGTEIQKAIADHNATTITIYYPDTDINIQDCTEDDLSSLRIRKQSISFPSATNTSAGVQLSLGDKNTCLSTQQCSVHPLTYSSNGLLPWTKIHHIVHCKKTIWENPELLTKAP